jgi:hypothetical protein
MKKKSVSDMTAEECIEKYLSLKLNPKICHSPKDYGEKNVKEHNKAMRTFIAFCSELSQNVELSKSVYSELLEHEDLSIQRNAASMCLELDIHVKRAVEMLENMAKLDDPWHAMPAERRLRIWRGEIDENDP